MDAQISKPANRSESGRFVPGVSGNPSGRPKKKPLTEALEEIYSDPKQAMAAAKALAKVVRKGNYKAFAEVADRIEGKVVQQVEHTGLIQHVLTEADKITAQSSIERIQALESSSEEPILAEWVDDKL
jgi:Family of unknown function (DUF5681)